MGGITSTRLDLAGYGTRVLASGGPGARVVLLHGYCDSADSWRELIPALAAEGIDSVALDLPGFGSADPLEPGPVVPQLAAFARAAVEHFGPGTLLVGNSLGSCAALLAAAENPGVAGVVATAEPTLGSSWLINKFNAVPESWLVRFLSMTWPVPRPVVKAFARLLLQQKSSEMTGLLVDEIVRRGPGQVVRGARGVALEVVGCYDSSVIDCPVLIVHGRRDRIIPTNSARALHAMLPTSELVIEDAWGHCPQHDDPRGLAAYIARFAREHVAQSSPGSPAYRRVPSPEGDAP